MKENATNGCSVQFSDWRAVYEGKLKNAEKAMQFIRRGHRVFIGSGCGEPQHLVRALDGHLLQGAIDQPAQQCFTDRVDL